MVQNYLLIAISFYPNIVCENVYFEMTLIRIILKLGSARGSITKPVLDRFQDSTKTGSGINFFVAFLSAFLLPFCCLFAAFFAYFFAAFFATLFAAFFANFYANFFWACFFGHFFE
jgi:hypothetical protein